MSTQSPFHKTDYGEMVLGDATDVMASMDEDSVDLVMTSPPFALLRNTEYREQWSVPQIL